MGVKERHTVRGEKSRLQQKELKMDDVKGSDYRFGGCAPRTKEYGTKERVV